MGLLLRLLSTWCAMTGRGSGNTYADRDATRERFADLSRRIDDQAEMIKRLERLVLELNLKLTDPSVDEVTKRYTEGGAK